MRIPGSLLFILTSCCIFAQEEQSADSVQRTATFDYNISGNAVELIPQPPPLIQIAGAPKAYYSYFWEFGDGNFSRKEHPRHVYKKEGEYEVNLWATNHYDNGKTPATRPQKVKVDKVTETYEARASLEDDLSLQRNREPVPEEDIAVVLSYKNPKAYVTGGKIYLFYNEQQYKDKNFELTDTRTYHGEKSVREDGFAYTGDISRETALLASAEKGTLFLTQKWQDSTERVNLPLTLEEAKARYKDRSILEFDHMSPGEERNVFFTLRTTPEMLKDTSAIVSVRSIYVPDENYDNHKVREMEMEIVTSHDPNKMSSNATVMNYRLVRFKTFRFKIRFQNNGEGPANTIRLETDIPDMFDKNTLEIEDLYPECPVCPKEENITYSCIDTTFTDKKAIFTFKNIYLPGSEQKNIKEYDSTKGFVKYRIKLAKDFHKKKTKSRTAIYFDKNEPVITNYATTRFLPGISIGAKAGYMISPDLDNHREYFAGITISPYKSYRGYLQAELMVSAGSFDKLRQFTEETVNENGFVDSYAIDALNEYRNLSLYLVPASYRYNLNNFLAVGTGLQLKADLSSKHCITSTGEYTLLIPSEGVNFRDDTRDFVTQTESTTAFANFQTGIFAGFNVGFARIGPSIGARYVYNFNSPHSQVQLYAIWKF
ncbi:PKD domain-containing protein [Sinomicrobium kalidii]|uniref:PKD domain-containing protein n=1 Tax=Sinomicrobium kalidii TaxID=2900738 RepID=UPI001E58EC22|nr:PKD domain-containing protein [Sinomicrobium kalidii]UGU14929.1 PKD domain-containing protein [Sinomicrobium kalidii]